MEKNINLTTEIDWKSFLACHDLVWPALQYRGGYMNPADRHFRGARRYKTEWDEGAFIGNGMVGAMIYQDSPQALCWELGRNDVVAHNFLAQIDWATPRVPIGSFLLTPAGTVIQETMRLGLWNAEASGHIETNVGSIRWRSIAHARQDLLIIDIRTTGAERVEFGFRPEHGVSHRIQYAEHKPWAGLLPPKPLQLRRHDVSLSVQTFVRDDKGHISTEGECAVAWKEIELEPHHHILYVSITNSRFDHSARTTAVDIVEQAAKTPLESLFATHQDWWHAYYPESFVSLPDTQWEGFYWVQIYKLACAMRADGVILDSQGPWLTLTPWPTTVWNLNVQLSYSPIYTANRLHLGKPLVQTLVQQQDVLRENARPAGLEDGAYIGRATNPVDLHISWPDTYELGNLTWALHNVWRHYRCIANDGFLRDKLFPLLRANINLYLHLMQKGNDGKWHIPATSSPEYPVKKNVNQYPIMDCTYTLALFRWGCQTLLEANAKLGLDDPLADRWQDVLDNLADYPIDENGLMIGAEVPFARSHRHFSHLLAFYPLHILRADQAGKRELIVKSISHWIGFEGALQGYSYTSAAAMAATLGDGNRALEYLNGLRDYLLPNTMYAESGPVIETPLSAAESLHYMLLQSWGDVIQIFPATPDTWTEASFHKLRAEGAFEVSAIRRDGKTSFVQITSLAGSPCKIRPNLEGKPQVAGSRAFELVQVAKGLYTLDLEQGETAILYSGTMPDLAIRSVVADRTLSGSLP